jgi:hypothetical protein
MVHKFSFQTKISPMPFIYEGYQPLYGSGQIIAIHMNFVIIRSAKPYLATGGAIVHSHYGEVVKEGDTLITLIYERFNDSLKPIAKINLIA